MQVSWQDLVELADAEFDLSQGLGNRINYILDAARINADDTCFTEKVEADWNKIAIGTIEETLSYSSDQEVIDWFKANGINF